MLVKFTGTASRNDGTGVITGLEDRPDILLGGEGELTVDEYEGLSRSGLVLEIVVEPEADDKPKPRGQSGGTTSTSTGATT